MYFQVFNISISAFDRYLKRISHIFIKFYFDLFQQVMEAEGANLITTAMARHPKHRYILIYYS